MLSPVVNFHYYIHLLSTGEAVCLINESVLIMKPLHQWRQILIMTILLFLSFKINSEETNDDYGYNNNNKNNHVLPEINVN